MQRAGSRNAHLPPRDSGCGWGFYRLAQASGGLAGGQERTGGAAAAPARPLPSLPRGLAARLATLLVSKHKTCGPFLVLVSGIITVMTCHAISPGFFGHYQDLEAFQA